MHFLIIFILAVLIIAYLKSPAFKGLVGESLVNQTINKNLDKNEYHLIKDITMPALSGATQIEQVIVSQYGIFVVETKYMKGWIFGGEGQKDWTQTFPGRKFKFQNPLHQNYKHIKTLAHMLDLSEHNFHSVIVFTGESTFKTTLPENVLSNSYIDYIKSKDTVIFSKAEVNDFIERIELFKIEHPRSTTKKQVAYLRQPYKT